MQSAGHTASFNRLRPRARVALLASGLSMATGCAILTPLDDVQPTKASTKPSKPSQVTGIEPNVSEAGMAMTEAKYVDPTPMAMPTTRVPDAGDEDANAAPEPCRPAVQASCNPAAQCGCGAGFHCGLDENEAAITCLSDAQFGGSGRGHRGQACSTPSDCAAGFECPPTKLCSRYCEGDSDCAANERCLPFENQSTRRLVPGADACQTVCDPVSNDPCPGGTKCTPAFINSSVKFAVCMRPDGTSFTSRGLSCYDASVICEPKFGCGRFGPEVCAPLCRTDADCPADLNHCYIKDRLAAPDQSIGDCAVSPCNDASVSVPPAWVRGAVLTRAAFEACKVACGPNPHQDPDCSRAECSRDFDVCITAAREACSASRTGPCRSEYVAANCSDAYERIGRKLAFEACMDAHPECLDAAQLTCVSDP